jgi:hypothetical protein
MQTKKRAKPVKFGKAAKEVEPKVASVAAPAEEPKVEAPVAAPEHPVAEKPAEAPQQPASQNSELVDKLSDVPFETDFNSPAAETPASAAVEPHAPSTPAPVEFTATSTNPAVPSTSEEPKAESIEPIAAPIDVNASTTVPPIGRSNEPIPFNPHETVFNTPPDAGEKKKNPFLYFLIIAFVAFVTGIAFMAGIYYAMPDKNFFAMPSIPSLPSLPGTTQPSPTPQPVAQSTVTPIPSVAAADYKIRVLNGSGVSGQAAKVKASLAAEGLTVTSTGNAETSDVQKTQITYKKTVSAATLAKVKDVLKKTYVLEKETELPSTAASEPDITITIGKQTAL